MEVLRGTLDSQLPLIEKAIEEADFLSFDAEFSGLHNSLSLRSHPLDDLQTRYEKYRKNAQEFLVVQFGLTCFKWSGEDDKGFLAKPFNFYVFPTTTSGRAQLDRVFVSQSSGLDFLAKHGFDFNKWVYQGIPYMTVQEEKIYVEKKMRELNGNMPDVQVDENCQAFVNELCQNIDDWLTIGQENYLNIDVSNGYRRRLVYQEVRNRYGPELVAEGRQGFIKISKTSDESRTKLKEEKIKLFEHDVQRAIGFRKIIDLICRSKKPIIGHNMFLDLCMIYEQFFEPLPERFEDFQRKIHEIFPSLYDTKHLASRILGLETSFGDSSLSELISRVKGAAFASPDIQIHYEHPRYWSDSYFHEAGYDAYCTGFVFLKLGGYLGKKSLPTSKEKQKVEHSSEYVYDYESMSSVEDSNWDYATGREITPATVSPPPFEIFKIPEITKEKNRLHLVKSDVDSFSLEEPNVMSLEKPNVFYVKIVEPAPTKFSPKLLTQHLYKTYGNVFIYSLKENQCFLTFKNVVDLEDVKGLLNSTPGLKVEMMSYKNYVDNKAVL
ncbi:CAF1-domain-containing protein [Basidiobolus meristosporus CBS 931.73]|uniref:CAF1-domain-containing protein n=1 Tax=Basidiobolus meristosporus CBS 931.73 TaxID=1314790 RepID=A0A1Y1Y108_9FUNG|nr:CAF1-domain-containing protein [Basidiobolus meristosporus CBS 931.73]|eukprot:ORX91701.1 CAF1-domain-containing protein [Basidiobolus meristosporus CBS 931.73]